MKKILLLIPLITSLSCSFNQKESGTLRLAVTFPAEGFSTKMIPADSRKVKVIISGFLISEPVERMLSPENPTLTLDVPSGDKKIYAEALDVFGEVLANGEGSLEVLPKKVNTARIELKLLKAFVVIPKQSPIPTPRPTPTPAPEGNNGENNNPQPSPTPEPTPLPTPSPTALPDFGDGSDDDRPDIQVDVEVEPDEIIGEPVGNNNAS